MVKMYKIKEWNKWKLGIQLKYLKVYGNMLSQYHGKV